MTNIVDVEIVDTTKVVETFTNETETTEDIQKQNMADFAKFFESLNRDKKRKMIRNRTRCKRLHTRVWTKKWVRQQITNRLSQCK